MLAPVKSWRLTVILPLLIAGCGANNLTDDGGDPPAGTGATGDPCATGGDCAGGLCMPFPDGYCSSDCADVACGAGAICRSVGNKPECLKACTGPGDCRSGYVCFESVCQPPCANDAGCPTGFGCVAGNCTPLTGTANGGRCKSDGDCASRRCDLNFDVCRKACLYESDCGMGQTCYVNPVDRNNDGSTDSLQPICIARRGKAGVGASCKTDLDCDAGQCELGVCVTLCQSGNDCSLAANLGCAAMIAQIDVGAPKITACLMKKGVLDYDLGPAGNSGPVGMPSNTLSFNIYVEAKGQSTDFYAGITNLDDPSGKSLYVSPMTPQDFYKNPIRYQGSEGSSMVLVSNSPVNVPMVTPGLWSFGTFAENKGGVASPLTARVRIKLGDAPPKTGSIPLHVFVTDLGGSACGQFDAASAPNALGNAIGLFQQIYAQAGVTISEVKFFDSKAANTFTQPDAGPDLELDALLKQATTGDTPDALELVVVKRIGGGSGNFEILGVAGGIPGATGIPGTVHSGATVSMTTLCGDKSQTIFAQTAAHELGHTLGLFHNIEQDKNTDPLTDTVADGNNNLMYWEESKDGHHLTVQQAQVILANPAVR